MTPLQQLGVTIPIVQAPMAGVSTPELAAAVSNAGALGSIGIGAADIVSARAMIQATRARTDKPFNVNVFVHAPARPDRAREQAWLDALRPVFVRFGAAPPATLRTIYQSFADDDDALSMLVETAPPVVSFHFGLPAADRIAAGVRAALRGPDAHHTIMTRVISGRPARCLANRFTGWGGECAGRGARLSHRLRCRQSTEPRRTGGG